MPVAIVESEVEVDANVSSATNVSVAAEDVSAVEEELEDEDATVVHEQEDEEDECVTTTFGAGLISAPSTPVAATAMSPAAAAVPIAVVPAVAAAAAAAVAPVATMPAATEKLPSVGIEELVLMAADARSEWDEKASSLAELFPEVPTTCTSVDELPLDIAAIQQLTTSMKQCISALKRELISSKVNGAGLEADLKAQPSMDFSVYAAETLADVPVSCAANAVTELLQHCRETSVTIVSDCLALEAQMLEAPAARIREISATVDEAQQRFEDQSEVRTMQAELSSQSAVEANFSEEVAALQAECDAFEAKRDALAASCSEMESRLSECELQARAAAELGPALAALNDERCDMEAVHAWTLIDSSPMRMVANFTQPRCVDLAGCGYSLVTEPTASSDDGSTSSFVSRIEIVATESTETPFTTFPGGLEHRRAFAQELMSSTEAFNVFGAAAAIASVDDFAEVRFQLFTSFFFLTFDCYTRAFLLLLTLVLSLSLSLSLSFLPRTRRVCARWTSA